MSQHTQTQVATNIPCTPAPEPAPLETVPESEPELWQGPTYYGMPALKAPPCKGYVPAYLYVGGVAGEAGRARDAVMSRP